MTTSYEVSLATRKNAQWFLKGKRGNIQGPFTVDEVRKLRVTSSIGPLDKFSCDREGPWHELRHIPELADDTPPPQEIGWEIASETIQKRRCLELHELQQFAKQGLLQPKTRIRNVPDGSWIQARQVPGLFEGDRLWCTSCGNELDGSRDHCPRCGERQIGYQPSLAMVALIGSLIALPWTILGIFSVTILALRRVVIAGYAMDESFPAAFVLTLCIPFALSFVSLVVGYAAHTAARTGLSAPVNVHTAQLAICCAWITIAILVLTTVAVVAFSISYFRVVL